MTALKPCSPPAKCPRWVPAAPDAGGGELPFDLMLDVLLRLPARHLCRMRAVCRSWRSLTADPLFIKEHAARHPDPLLLANFPDDPAHISVVDLYGKVAKRIASPDGHQLLCTRLDLACVAAEWNSCCVLDPATGAACILPGDPIQNVSRRNTSFAFGQIAATGEYKALRVFNRCDRAGFVEEQGFEVFTINCDVNNARWRNMQSPKLLVDARNAVVVDGVVYLLRLSPMG